MSQVNINPNVPSGPTNTGDSAVAAGINLVTVLIVLAVAIVIIAAIIWLFTGSGFFAHGGAAPTSGNGASPIPTAVPKKSDIINYLAAFV